MLFSSRAAPVPCLVSPSSRLSLLLDALRCWRRARDGGDATQPKLYARLRRYRCEMLAPVLDSLMLFTEQVLGHSLRIGRKGEISPDENFLLDVYEGRWTGLARLPCSKGLATTFCGAVVSARIMMELVLGPPESVIFRHPSRPDRRVTAYA